jgi:Exopolysaccharide biosynthesis protein YbjH
VLARFRSLIVAAALCAGAACQGARGQVPGEPPSFLPSYNDWGEYGLLQSPSARTGTDGDFAFTYSHVHPYDRYNVFFTPLPWLEGGFRYTAITNRPYSPTIPNQSYKDKSIDIKIRLSKESADFPETAIGFRDVAGTGLFSGEYLVFNRRYYDFDISAGMGWGYLASNRALSNPLGVFSQTFKTRQPATAAGAFTLDYFRGAKVGLFGGIEYHTPIEGVRLKLEYDPSDYQHEPQGNSFVVRSPVNFGVVYRPYSFWEMSAGIERGTTLMLRATINSNFNTLGLFRDTTEPPKVIPRPRPTMEVGVPLDETSLPRVTGRPVLSPGPAAPAPIGLAKASAPPPTPARSSARGAEARAEAGVDRLYDGARRLGYDITDVAIDGTIARLAVAPIEGRARGGRSALRALARANLEGVTQVVVAEGSAAARVSAAPAATSEQAVAQRVFADLAKIGFVGESFAVRGPHAWLSLSQNKYHFVTIALGRAARIVAADSPQEVELITIDLLEDNLTAASVTIYRRDLENAVADMGSPEEIFEHARLAHSDPDRPPGIANAAAYPSLEWGINPRLRQQLGGPDNFLIYQIYAELSGTAHLAPGLSLDAGLGANLFNNLNALHPQPASALPHVRSDIGFYLKKGKSGIFQLHGDYLFNIAPDWYGRVSAGYLEYMYAGFDGEVLYRPYDQRFAIGLDVNHVIKRNFNELFGLQRYRITEGQLSFYYKLPFYNLTAAIRVGRYLAGDKGATVALWRDFVGGVRAGIFATKTNISAAQFGEGSFDKGFFISFPLDLLLGNPSRSEAHYVYRPLTRDGGQYLEVTKPLYDETDGYDPETLSSMWPQLLH